MADFRLELERMEESANHFKSIEIGHYVLSIQASEGHYCTPRQTLPKATDYLSFELAVINKYSREFMHPNQSSVLREILKEESITHRIMGWVSYETIQHLIDALRSREMLKDL